MATSACSMKFCPTLSVSSAAPAGAVSETFGLERPAAFPTVIDCVSLDFDTNVGAPVLTSFGGVEIAHEKSAAGCGDAGAVKVQRTVSLAAKPRVNGSAGAPKPDGTVSVTAREPAIPACPRLETFAPR